jgi:hypothetical protein
MDPMSHPRQLSTEIQCLSVMNPSVKGGSSILERHQTKDGKAFE